MLTDPTKRVITRLILKFMAESWRGCRVAEGPALEKRYPVKNGIVGSNPTLSARKFWCPGEMSELAEGARLEIVCTAKSGTEGSNPSLSARKRNH